MPRDNVFPVVSADADFPHAAAVGAADNAQVQSGARRCQVVGPLHKVFHAVVRVVGPVGGSAVVRCGFRGGRRDVCLAREGGKRFGKRIAGRAVVVVPGLEHMLHQPQQVAAFPEIAVGHDASPCCGTGTGSPTGSASRRNLSCTNRLAAVASAEVRSSTLTFAGASRK